MHWDKKKCVQQHISLPRMDSEQKRAGERAHEWQSGDEVRVEERERKCE